jgi:hypothetical protein
VDVPLTLGQDDEAAGGGIHLPSLRNKTPAGGAAATPSDVSVDHLC